MNLDRGVLEVLDRGCEAFEDTYRLQLDLVGMAISDPNSRDFLVLVEHFPVYTFGRSCESKFVGSGFAKGVPCVPVNRGGLATFHGKGQLVVYPIVNLGRCVSNVVEGSECLADPGKDVHAYLRKLEQSAIQALLPFSVDAYALEHKTGIWVDKSGSQDSDDLPVVAKKIASIGVAVRKWVTYHGIAINVYTDLDFFKEISPCGENGEVMTSLFEIAPVRGMKFRDLMVAVKESVISSIAEVFGYSEVVRSNGSMHCDKKKYPFWIKSKGIGSAEYLATSNILKDHEVVTVCEEAKCPNIGECWSKGVATFMIMGDSCTRGCRFCSVKRGALRGLDIAEPDRLGRVVAALKLAHIVVTSVTRDDIEDMGAAHFASVVRAIKVAMPYSSVELLIPDMQGRHDLIDVILSNRDVSVLGHNVETVPRLYSSVRPGANFHWSLSILDYAKKYFYKFMQDNHDVESRKIRLPVMNFKTKSGLMVGLGESEEEVVEVMDLLRGVGVDILTIGQYLMPTRKQVPVVTYIEPEQFENYARLARERGFLHVESGPLVRSSYRTWNYV